MKQEINYYNYNCSLFQWKRFLLFAESEAIELKRVQHLIEKAAKNEI